MTVEIARHQVKVSSEEALEMREENLVTRLGKLDSSNFSTVNSSALSLAAGRCALDPEAEMFGTWDAVVRSMQISSALFASVRPQAREMRRLVAHEVREVEASGPQYYASAANWLDAFWLAVICREADRMTELCRVPVDVLRQGAPDAFDEYIYSWVGALQCYWLREGDVASHLMAAMEQTDPAQLRESSQDQVLRVMYPSIVVFLRFLQRDNEGFNRALTQALTWHKEYWDTEDRSFIASGNIALGPLALACMARDSGFPLEVESPYMPKYLIEGAWLNEFDTEVSEARQGGVEDEPAAVPGVPASGEEAVARVMEAYGRPSWPDGTPAPMNVKEYEVGFVVWPTFPQPEPVNGVPQPAEPGGSHYVVAKDNGQIALVPNFPPDTAIEVFVRHYRNGGNQS